MMAMATESNDDGAGLVSVVVPALNEADNLPAPSAPSSSKRSTPGRWSNDRHLIGPPQWVHSSCVETPKLI